MLLRILQLLFGHGMCSWWSCIGGLSDNILLNLLVHYCTTHTRFCSNLLFFFRICRPFSDLRVIVTFLFHLDVFVFLLPCRKIRSAFAVHAQLWPRIPVHWASHGLILFKNCSLMDFLKLMEFRCCHWVSNLELVGFIHLVRLETSTNFLFISSESTLASNLGTGTLCILLA